MNGGTARPGLRAGEDAQGLSIDQVVVRLRGVLGARLVAYIGNVTKTSIVRAWAEGDDAPNPDNDCRLRTALHALGILEEGIDPITISTWFQGMNPFLGDESPARYIRNAVPGAADDVLVAARSMLVS
ncbi:hypothetical protein ACFQ9V_01635 [Leifsonia sp. NPDC056665]|uniref:hypothetical protein n=1 Tax=Leifsonia sp. NPDC056665 TaxID=3345901 RepID=UPI0036C8194E